ncbi:hypothetical protein EON64_19610 [archaeon]|nr:MAG: hypothetical protein EON64_19610 [archaeon]
MAGSRGPSQRPAPPGLPYLSLSNVPSSVKLLTPFIPSGSVSSELEVLNLIAKVSSVNPYVSMLCLQLISVPLGMWCRCPE